jgi:hypothetical protein
VSAICTGQRNAAGLSAYVSRILALDEAGSFASMVIADTGHWTLHDPQRTHIVSSITCRW